MAHSYNPSYFVQPISKYPMLKIPDRVAQVVEPLPSNGSNPVPPKREKEKVAHVLYHIFLFRFFFFVFAFDKNFSNFFFFHFCRIFCHPSIP
jgi:hypothetical protein